MCLALPGRYRDNRASHGDLARSSAGRAHGRGGPRRTADPGLRRTGPQSAVARYDSAASHGAFCTSARDASCAGSVSSFGLPVRGSDDRVLGRSGNRLRESGAAQPADDDPSSIGQRCDGLGSSSRSRVRLAAFASAPAYRALSRAAPHAEADRRHGSRPGAGPAVGRRRRWSHHAALEPGSRFHHFPHNREHFRRRDVPQ